MWDKHGLDFLGSFLFETPLIVLGVGAWLFLVVTAAFCILGVVYQWNLSRKAAPIF